MKRRNAAFLIALGCSGALLGGVLASSYLGERLLPASANASYELKLDSYAGLTSGINTDNGNKISFTYSGASNSGGKIALNKTGYIYNTTQISGIERVEVTLSSGSVDIYYDKDSSHSVWNDSTSGTDYDLEGIYPNYFKVVATANAVIDKITVTYACVDYQKAATEAGYKLYVNDVESDSTFFEVDKEGNDLQLKAILDVYPGDVLTFTKNGSSIIPSASAGDGNNAYQENSRNYLMVTSHAKGAHLYLKKNGSNYDVWLTGKGNLTPKSDIASGSILQAWNWTVANIRSNLTAIKNAGYTAIQVSPMQTRKYVSTSAAWTGEWWKLYQPYGFSVASGGNCALGSANDLKTLCTEAKALGLHVVMDVVLNHLSGGSESTFNGDCATYEPSIVNNDLIHKNGKIGSDNSQFAVLRKTLGDYPDLQTENPIVMGRALSLLKDYLDLGVTGFRFDAAKHIETPKDGIYASSFWPHVVNGAKRYADKKGYDVPYFYGEILGAGDDRSIHWYTDYMSITEWTRTTDLRDAVGNGNVSKLNQYYPDGLAASNMVLWAESHDQYQSGESSWLSRVNVNKAYAIQASRDGAVPVYMARPDSGSTLLGAASDSGWKDPAVAAANKLHSMFAGKGEYVEINYGDAKSFVNGRGSYATEGGA
nr:hypothetical protein [Bacilli bacterium]